MTLIYKLNCIVPRLLVLAVLLASFSAWSYDPKNIRGPEECAECHDVENGIWESTHHFTTFEAMPESEESLEISEKMGVDDPIESEICQGCHLTMRSDEGELEAIAGVSCESCHGAAADWIEPHSEEDKTAEQKKTIWPKAVAAGMIRPQNIDLLVANCLGCHIVPDEKLVNVGGHTAGSEYNLVTWSQGEIRHNTFHTEGGKNREASAEKKRIMLVVGFAQDMALSMKALAKATSADGEYAKSLISRINAAKKSFAKIAAAMPAQADIQKIQKIVKGTKLTPGNAGMSSAAAGIAGPAKAIAAADATSWAALDALVAAQGKYRGAATE